MFTALKFKAEKFKKYLAVHLKTLINPFHVNMLFFNGK